MMKFLGVMLLLFFPVLALADAGSLSFAPPPGDYSVIFLGNLFGVVDGVLHGTGSQIMGAMFGVFNAAVLALGGIIIMYTLMVSTMNTAHEGQMLGQKWSSIWIPVRSTLGLALLIPKASGYCLMQIFVMWLVVQGAGAADKVWDAALSYLNRGGVIVKAQQSPMDDFSGMNPASAESQLMKGAITILSGQVCMLGLQKQLEEQRQKYVDQGEKGPCSVKPISDLCKTAVPDFLGSVNAVVEQSKYPTAKTFELSMPNFDPNTYPDYAFLNGMCGKITWSRIPMFADPVNPQGQNNSVTAPGCTKNCTSVALSSGEYQAAQMSRAIAIQQMYLDLGSVAETMVNNDPQIGKKLSDTGSDNFSSVAKQQFGISYTENNVICSKYEDGCTNWGLVASSTASAGLLFSGTEFQGAMNDYNAVMSPTLNLMNATQQGQNANDERAFINSASSKGWIMAGTYFFDLVRLNGNAQENSNTKDEDSGLGGSEFSASDVGDACPLVPEAGDKKPNKLCAWFANDSSKLVAIEALIDGLGVEGSNNTTLNPPVTDNSIRRATEGKLSSTAYGFMNNSLMIRTPEQPGFEKIKFAKNMTFTVDTSTLKLKPQKFDCGKVKILFFKFCLGWMLGNIFYNLIFLNIYNTLMLFFQQIIQQVVMAFLMIPLMGMSTIFKEGLGILNQPGVNPIVALANMGVRYINFSGDLWIMLMGLSVTSILIPWFGIFIMALIAMAMPLILAWVGVMVGIGFTTAYYIPLLPYMMFLFGSIAWLICVIEAMVAAPIVALGITHPEGHDAFGKGEQAIMILLNVFLRPAMMIIGYIAAISLSYVGIWLLNAGFDHAISFIQGGSGATGPGGKITGSSLVGGGGGGPPSSPVDVQANPFSTSKPQGSGSGETRYTAWAGIYAFFFSILAYTTIYLIIVQQSFSMISILPDKILRWIGGTPEQLGQEASRWGEELKGSTKSAGEETGKAAGQIGKQISGRAEKGIASAKDAVQKALTGGGDVSASGGGAGGGAGGGGAGGAAGGAVGGAKGGSAGAAVGKAVGKSVGGAIGGDKK